MSISNVTTSEATQLSMHMCLETIRLTGMKHISQPTKRREKSMLVLSTKVAVNAQTKFFLPHFSTETCLHLVAMIFTFDIVALAGNSFSPASWPLLKGVTDAKIQALATANWQTFSVGKFVKEE